MHQAFGLLSALQWARGLNMDFETHSKVVVYSIYRGSDGVSDFMAIIKDSRHLLIICLTNSGVKFIQRQINGVS